MCGEGGPGQIPGRAGQSQHTPPAPPGTHREPHRPVQMLTRTHRHTNAQCTHAYAHAHMPVFLLCQSFLLSGHTGLGTGARGPGASRRQRSLRAVMGTRAHGGRVLILFPWAVGGPAGPRGVGRDRGEPYPRGPNWRPLLVPCGGPPHLAGGHTAGSETPSGWPAAALRPTAEESEA